MLLATAVTAISLVKGSRLNFELVSVSILGLGS